VPNLLEPLTNKSGFRIGWMFWCPACGCRHAFRTIRTIESMPRQPVWKFNDSVTSPTVAPSVVTDDRKGIICKVLLLNGILRFSTECRHEMAGRTVPMEPPPP